MPRPFFIFSPLAKRIEISTTSGWSSCHSGLYGDVFSFFSKWLLSRLRFTTGAKICILGTNRSFVIFCFIRIFNYSNSILCQNGSSLFQEFLYPTISTDFPALFLLFDFVLLYLPSHYSNPLEQFSRAMVLLVLSSRLFSYFPLALIWPDAFLVARH